MAEINNRNKLSQEKSNWFENQLKPIAKFLIYLRVPLTVAIAAWYFFSQIDQTIEVYRAIALDNNVPQAVFSTVFVVLLSVFVWFAARLLEKCYKDRLPEYYKPKFDSLYKNAPRLLGAIPLGSIAYGTWATQNTLQKLSARTPTPKIFLLVWMFSNIVLLGIFFYLLIKRSEIFKDSKYLDALASNKMGEGLFGQRFENIFVNIACFVFSLLSLPLIVAAKDSRWSFGLIGVFLSIVFLNVGLFSWQNTLKSRITVVRTCSISLLASLVLGLMIPPTFLPDLLGSISVVAIALAILVVVFSTLYNGGQQTKIPGITILIGLTLVSSALNLDRKSGSA